MSLNLSAIAVRERAVTLFFILLLAAAGAYAFVMLGRAEDPNFTIKTLTVTTVWPGATAREMQDLVAEPLEKRLQELTWYDRVETTTRPGYAYMTVTLKDSTPPSKQRFVDWPTDGHFARGLGRSQLRGLRDRGLVCLRRSGGPDDGP